MAHLTSHHTLPPFPDDIPTAPLVSIALAQLEAGSSEASAALFDACKALGFFYLDMNGSKLGETIVAEAEELNELQKRFFSLPYEDKDVYGRPHLDPFYAYRYSDTNAVGNDGVPLRKENYNLRKDDILGQCDRLACHPMILAANDLYTRYVRHCRSVIDCLLEHLNTHLELPAGTLAGLHRVDQRSGDHVRFIRSPPDVYDEASAQRAEHTDFGSLTILFNWLGGLQIRTPDTNEWVFVRPIPGSCVINIGDALVTFTAGLLRSNVHRVVPAVGAQAALPRNSLVYFSRPEDNIVLRRLSGGIIDAQPELDNGQPPMTAAQWILAKGTGQLPGVFTAKGHEHRDFRRHASVAKPPVAVV